MAAKTVDEYISAYPVAIQNKLKEMRQLIKGAAPNATEDISYGMPAYKLNGIIAYFGANKKHIGFYPTPSPIKAFEQELKDYATSKGAIQFPYDKPIPGKLVNRIIAYRISELNTKNK